MASRPILRSLMAGVALASLSTVALAEGWNGMVIFGGRNYDEGQYVSYETVFAEEGDETGDGRQRATNAIQSGGRGPVVSQLVARSLGFGDLNPSQPVSYEGSPTPPDGTNYASTFYSTYDILQSITGTSNTGTIYYNDAGEEVAIEGRSRPGFLVDPDRKGNAWGALVLIEGGTLDLRSTAEIYRGSDRVVDLGASRIVRNSVGRDRIARNAAANIVQGVDELTTAGAGLVVVANAYDVGRIPEVGGDNELLVEARRQMTTLENDAAVAESRALDAEANAKAASEADMDNADTLRAMANVARYEADQAALSAYEIYLRDGIDAALADPTLLATIRTAATDEYNARLLEGVRNIDGNIVMLDQRALIDAVIADPARFGLSDDFDQANDCQFDDEFFPCNAVGGFAGDLLFMDGVQLSETGHQLLADQMVALVNAPAAFGGLPATGISSGRSVSDVARDQLSREQTWVPGIAPFVAGAASRVKLSPSTGFPQQDASFTSGIAGLKYVLPNGIAFGAAGGYQKINSPGDKSAFDYDGDALVGTLFAGINSGPIFGSATATLGKLDYGDLTRVTRIGDARIRNSGEAEGTVSGVTAEAGLRLVSYDILRAGPIANFSHWKSEIDGYSENGWQTTAVRTDGLETTSTRAGLGMFLEAGNFVDGQGAMFRAKALYGHEFGDDTQTVSVTPLGANSVGSFSAQSRGVDSAPLEFGAEIVFGYGGVFTTLGYNGLFGDFSDHRFRVGASLPLGG